VGEIIVVVSGKVVWMTLADENEDEPSLLREKASSTSYGTSGAISDVVCS